MGAQRDRTPSLGSLHQELEAEQEAQVVSDFSITISCIHMPLSTDLAMRIRTVY